LEKLNKKDIEEIIPHRDPFLLIDEIREMEPGKRVTAIKYLRTDEYYFKGHFPSNPIMPGVLMLEAIAQAGAVALLVLPENKGKIALFAGIDKARFKKLVRPGDELLIEVELTDFKMNIGKARGTVKCSGSLVCSAEIMFALS
jgi:3-hydroxyacyl-[acyl-carrier-protein] dehydratase